MNLTDKIIDDIERYSYNCSKFGNINQPNMNKAEEILKKIRYRDLYKFVSEIVIDPAIKIDE